MKMRRRPLGIYVHVPFCARKCRYCDFLSFDDADGELHRRYVAQAVQEIVGRSAVYNNQYMVDSIFVGGGTPTLLPPRLLDELLDALYARFRIAPGVETTVEANPGTVSLYDLLALRHAGVGRLSFGVQSFDEGKLRTLGRIHSPETAVRAFHAARRARFRNINIDLIFGVPGETQAVWQRDLAMALELSPEHISFYDLQVEEGTPLHGDIAEGRLVPMDDIEDRRLYHLAIEQLTEAGYAHYEISNMARRGCMSRHNLKYWSMDDYLGIGLGAHSYIRGRRSANTEDLAAYLCAASADAMTASVTVNRKSDEMSEYIFLGLRRTEGIDLTAFRERFGVDFDSLYAEEANGLIGRRLLDREGDRLRLTQLGLDLSNIVFREFV